MVKDNGLSTIELVLVLNVKNSYFTIQKNIPALKGYEYV